MYLDLAHHDKTPSYHARLIWCELFNIYREYCNLDIMYDMTCDLTALIKILEANQDVTIFWAAHNCGTTHLGVISDEDDIALTAGACRPYTIAMVIKYDGISITVEKYDE